MPGWQPNMNKENNKKDMALLSCGYISLCQTSLDVLLHLKCVLRENTSDHRICIQEAAFSHPRTQSFTGSASHDAQLHFELYSDYNWSNLAFKQFLKQQSCLKLDTFPSASVAS